MSLSPDAIYRTEHYDIIVEDSPKKSHREAGVRCYGIRNRAYAVVEAHVGTLPGAIQMAADLTAALKEGPVSMEKRVEKQLAAMGFGEPPTFPAQANKQKLS